MNDTTILTWAPVAFVRQTSGRLHILFALDRDGRAVHEGEPVLLVDHRPGAAHDDIGFDASSEVEAHFVACLDDHRTEFAACFTAAFARDGSFDADRLLTQRVRIELTS